MTIQPKHHWLFAERSGTETTDRFNNAQGQFINDVIWQEHGRIGDAVAVKGSKAHIDFDPEVAQFGTSDFTIAFGMKNLSSRGQDKLDIIGNQPTVETTNTFIVKLLNKSQINFRVFGSGSEGVLEAETVPLTLSNDKKWHHIALVRQGNILRIYVDGKLEAEDSFIVNDLSGLTRPFPIGGRLPRNSGRSTAVSSTNNEEETPSINGDAALRLGHWTSDTAHALYEDLRIYDVALTDSQIQNLVTPFNRPLRPGQVELIAPDDAAIILTEDVADLRDFSDQVQKIRFGPNTGATIYRNTNFTGASHKLYTDIPETRHSRTESFPRSIRVWSSVGAPFTGRWVFATSNGEYLSWNGTTLTTSPNITSNEMFILHHNRYTNQAQFMPLNDVNGLLFPLTLLVNNSELDNKGFPFVNVKQDKWLVLNADKTFGWTQVRENRTYFYPVIKLADSEGQIGKLNPGEVAIHKLRAYGGRTWILSDNHPITGGDYEDLRAIPALHDDADSIRLGPDTGVTMFKHISFQNNNNNDLDDLVASAPDLGETQIRNNELSGIKIFRLIAPEKILTSHTSKLSEDYREKGDALEQFSAYRTVLRFPAEVEEVIIEATDATTIEVAGEFHEISEVKSVTLRPNAMNRIVITSEAEGLTTPGIKFRTSAMPENERVVIFPDEEAHKQLAEMEDGALWNAKDAEGNPVVDQSQFTESEIGNVQNTIKRVMSTVVYQDEPPVDVVGTGANTVNSQATRIKSQNRNVSGETIGNPWVLHLEPKSTPNTGEGSSLVVSGDVVREEPISQNAFEQMLQQSVVNTASTDATGTLFTGVDFVASAQSARGFLSDFGDAIKDTFNDAKDVVVGFANDVLNVIIDGVNFILDTAAKVAQFVEALIDKVVSSIQAFIEFLRFLFAWDDIVATQGFIVDSINNMIDYSKDLVNSAKQPVKNFIDNLQETVDDGMNNLIQALSGQPGAGQGTDFDIPEALEWLLDKFMSRSSGSVGSGFLPDNSSGAGKFFNDISDRIGEAKTGALIETVEGMVGIIETLVADPAKPELAAVELIDALRDTIIQSLEIVEDFTLDLLDLIVAAIDGFQDILNGNFNIPFISKLLDLIGIGNFSLLKFTSLLIAIPATAVSKSITGTRPFVGVQPINLNSTVNQTQLSSDSVQVIEASAQAASEDDDNFDNLVKGFAILSVATDMITGITNGVLDFFPENFDDVNEVLAGWLEVINIVASGVSWFASFPASPGIPGGFPYDVRNHPVDPQDDKMEFRERMMWGWRTGVLALDICFIVVSRDQSPNLQRMRRASAETIWLYCALSCIDMLFTGLYVAAIPEDDDEQEHRINVATEILGVLPGIIAPVRLVTGPFPLQFILSGMLSALDLTAATLSSGSTITDLMED